LRATNEGFWILFHDTQFTSCCCKFTSGLVGAFHDRWKGITKVGTLEFSFSDLGLARSLFVWLHTELSWSFGSRRGLVSIWIPTELWWPFDDLYDHIC
jgi:hypothetical protein